jgi:hypothetical protein
VSHPINTAEDYVIKPLRSIPADPALQSALATYQAAREKQKKEWTEAYAKPLEEYAKAVEEKKTPPTTVSVDSTAGAVMVKASGAGPVPTMIGSLLALAQSGGLDGDLLTSRQFYQTDYTKPLLFMADGGLLAERAEAQHLLGKQWGIMNETGSYPGQTWLWLYTLWYQVEPVQSLTQRGCAGCAGGGRAEPPARLHPAHPRPTRHPALDPAVSAHLARALPLARHAARRLMTGGAVSRTSAHPRRCP